MIKEKGTLTFLICGERRLLGVERKRLDCQLPLHFERKEEQEQDQRGSDLKAKLEERRQTIRKGMREEEVAETPRRRTEEGVVGSGRMGVERERGTRNVIGEDDKRKC